MGRYVLGTSIGVGGAAAVYLARLDGPEGFERLLAIKVVHEHLLEDRQFIAMILDEANLAVRLSHPNIVHTYELGREGDRLFIAMELLRGKPLSSVQEAAFAAGSPLPYDLVAWLGARCADALHYAHELRGDDGNPLRIVHRDISPDNLFVTYDGDVKIIDFGIARAEGRLTQSTLGTVKGKFRYMSPEYALGQSFDHTLDLFALGASLYEAALGRAAFEAEDIVGTLDRLVMGDFLDPREIRADFPLELSRVLQRAMSSDRQARYPDGLAMARDLDRIAGVSSTDARDRLSRRMRELFALEIEEESAALSVMRTARFSSELTESTSLHQALSDPAKTQIPPTPSPPHARARLLVAVVVAIGLALAGYGWVKGTVRSPVRSAAVPLTGSASEPKPLPEAKPLPEPKPVTPAEHTEASPVMLDVAVLPADTRASIRVGEQTITARPARTRVPYGTSPVVVEVSAEGFVASRIEIIPDHDQSLVVPLAVSVSPQPTSRSRKPARMPGTASTREESGVIRENPFGDRKP